MRIYTSYFARVKDLPKAIKPIGIVRYLPRWNRGLANYKTLTPEGAWLRFREDLFRNKFGAYLNSLDASNVVSDLKQLSGGSDIALICYEKPGEFCHRCMVAEWLSKEVEYKIEEYEFHPRQFSLFNERNP